ncbi:MAG: Spo0B domain-containing protein [Lachnospiraceae bacterium]|nr:Spo0B domain-containing protein [Lachnospiraceae bacterium]
MGSIEIYLIITASLALILAISAALLARSFKKQAKRNDSLVESLENLSRLNDKLRTDRHDYLNHLQVIYGLMELKEYDEMNSYLRKVYKELLKTGKAIKTSKPALNALLAAKMAEAESSNVEFVVEVKSDLSKLSIEDWELCKILSNIMDNAMRALEESDREEKHIGVNITETPDKYIFEVSNNGPAIPEEMQAKIFKKGFSTKKEEGHGMGLSIVADSLYANKGKIGLNSNEEETVFTVEFEKGE